MSWRSVRRSISTSYCSRAAAKAAAFALSMLDCLRPAMVSFRLPVGQSYQVRTSMSRQGRYHSGLDGDGDHGESVDLSLHKRNEITWRIVGQPQQHRRDDLDRNGPHTGIAVHSVS